MAVATASDISKDTRENVVEFLEKVEPCGKWPQKACTDEVFFDSEEYLQ